VAAHAVLPAAAARRRRLTSAVNTRHAAYLAVVLNSLGPLQELVVEPRELKARATDALDKCLEKAAKNTQLCELQREAREADKPIDKLLDELRSKDGSFVEARGFQKRRVRRIDAHGQNPWLRAAVDGSGSCTGSASCHRSSSVHHIRQFACAKIATY
jgi:hypothetical protein